MDLGSQAASVGALADPTRRALYQYVAGSAEPVGREQAAEALEIAPHTVAFHLDKLVEAGLLETDYRRLTGRSGPGAGRPSKLYRRAPGEVSVSLPARRYDLVGEILARGIERATGPEPEALKAAIKEAASETGQAIGAAAAPGGVERFTEVLAGQGFEPRLDERREQVLLSNCPFDALARSHTALVCGLNQAFVQGVADGLGCDGVRARLEPEPGQCCVKARVRSAR